jgi:hypothetical protein
VKRSSIIATLLLAALALGGCAATSGALNSAASAVASAGGLPAPAAQLQVLSGNLDSDLFRALMSLRAGLIDWSDAAVGDPVLTALVDRQIGQFNAGIAQIIHIRKLFGGFNAVVAEGISLQGKPADWSQLTPVPPVPLAPVPTPAAPPPHP